MTTSGHRDQVYVLVARHRGGLLNLEAALGRQCGGVHIGDRVVAGRAEEALQDRQREDLGPRAGDLAVVGDLEVAGLAVDEAA